MTTNNHSSGLTCKEENMPFITNQALAKPCRQTQQDCLMDAMRRLGMTPESFAKRLGLSTSAMLHKWLAPTDAKNQYHEMPDVVWSLVREILAHEDLKAKCVKGNR